MNSAKLLRLHQKELSRIRKTKKAKRITDKNTWKMLNSWSLSLKGIQYDEFLKSEYWKIVRVFVLRRDKFKCTKCGDKGILQVHHKTYKNHLQEHKHLNDLTTLCDICHKNEHSKSAAYE